MPFPATTPPLPPLEPFVIGLPRTRLLSADDVFAPLSVLLVSFVVLFEEVLPILDSLFVTGGAFAAVSSSSCKFPSSAGASAADSLCCVVVNDVVELLAVADFASCR